MAGGLARVPWSITGPLNLGQDDLPASQAVRVGRGHLPQTLLLLPDSPFTLLFLPRFPGNSICLPKATGQRGEEKAHLQNLATPVLCGKGALFSTISPSFAGVLGKDWEVSFFSPPTHPFSLTFCDLGACIFLSLTPVTCFIPKLTNVLFKRQICGFESLLCGPQIMPPTLVWLTGDAGEHWHVK